MAHTYQVKLDAFEGPLDLLLHLINQYEIDIHDIPVAQITQQYMNYIHTMQRLELNIASEYLVMAATLVAIKSQMLLPKQEIVEEVDEYEEDPREELMHRLIEYRKFKNAANQLKERELDAIQTFTRPQKIFENLFSAESSKIVQGDISVYDMLGALGKMFDRKKWDEPLDTKVKREEISIEQRMEEVSQYLRNFSHGVSFDHLFSLKTKSHIIVTFMALLELMKEKKVYCKQANNFDELFVFCTDRS